MTTTENLKLNFNQADRLTLCFFVFLAIVFLIVLIDFLRELYMQDYHYIMKSGLALVLSGIVLIFLGINIFTPLTLTKKTEIKTNELKIIKVEDKISDSGELKLLVKSNDGEISTRNLNINDKNTIVKISSRDEIYTEKVTQIIYSTKQKINAETKNSPKNEMKKEVTVYLRGNQID
ncbi:hypothetical protein ACI1TW_09880 [Lactococcus garvieae]|uniref:hypothetical protein n=1 Tax=Lactococcus garvieae TaxID=1363 RepID=UPI003852BBC2